MEKENKINLVVPKDYNGTPIEVVLREGKAAVALDPKEPEKVVISGTIDAPFKWLEKRVELINQKSANIIVNRDKMCLTVTIDETNYYQTIIGGVLQASKEMQEFGINTDKKWEPIKLSQFFKMHRAFFKDKSENMILVSTLKNFKAKVNQDIERSKEENGMEMISLAQELRENSYPGRGIILGRSEDGTKAVAAYFIMGRSENSRNRIFVEDGEGIRTQAYDPSKLTDPSLIIYAPVRVLGNKTIVTNGDQTDTIYEGMDRQLTFEQALRSREFEPDAPNYTPRISGIMHIESGTYSYAMSILKSNNGDPSSCLRFTFAYNNCAAGEGHFIHTYKGDGNPLPSFEGEPKLVAIPNDMEKFTNMLWNNLNEDNKVSLFVRYIDIATGKYQTVIKNKNGQEE